MSLDQTGLQIGVFTFSYFGMVIVLAVAVAGVWSARRAPQHEGVTGHIIDMIIWGVGLGLILARVFYILNPPPSVARYYDRSWYLEHILDFQIGPLAIWSGGLGMAGALLGGVIGGGIVFRQHRLDLRMWGDILAPGVLAGLVIAPWANIVTQKLYGPPTGVPWAMKVDAPVPPFENFTRFHPTPAYVSLWMLLALIFVLIINRQWANLKPGTLSFITSMIILDGLFLAGFLQLDVSRGLLNLTGLQWLSLVGMLGAGWGWYILNRRENRDE